MNLNDYKGILVYAEQRDGVLQNVGLELLGKATELAYEINKQIALKNAGDELADYATKQAAAIKSIDAVAATLEEEDEKVKEKVEEVRQINIMFSELLQKIWDISSEIFEKDIYPF